MSDQQGAAEAAPVWVQVPPEWVYRERHKAYITSGGHSIGPVLAITDPSPGLPVEGGGVEGEDLAAWVCVPRRWLVRQGSYLYLLSQGMRSMGPVIALAEPAPPGTPAELAGLPAEVRALVHAVDAVRDRWAEADEAVRGELWGKAHAAADAVWHRPLIR